MYRTLMSALRVGCIGAMMMPLAAPVVSGETHEEAATNMRSSERMSSQSGSQSMESQTTSKGDMTSAATYERAAHLIGCVVRGREGEKLGTIEDIVLNAGGDSVSYAVLAYGGFLGFGDKLFAVPWSEFQRHSEKEAYTLDVRKEYLKNAPGFSKHHWPNTAGKDWAQHIETFYRQGRQASRQTDQMGSSQEPMVRQSKSQLPMKCRRVSQLISLPAKDFQGARLGALDDVVIDPDNGEVVYGVVILDTTPWALDRELAVVPWSTIEIVPELAALRLDADESMLEDVAFARGEGFPYLGDPMYAQDVETTFEATPYWETLGYVSGEGPMAGDMQSGPMAEDIEVAAWRPGSEYNQRFDPGLVTSVRGTIRSIGTFDIGRNTVKGLRLRVKADDGKTWTIHAGPRPFIESKGVTLHFGDEITVTGAPTRIGWRGKILLASTIQTGDQTFRLRAANGTPQWNADALMSGNSSNR